MNKAMSLVFLSTIFLCMSSLFAQDDAGTAGAPGCGAPDSKYDVKTEKEKRSAQPEAGKALVYFIEDDSTFESRPKPTTRMGIDGNWVGATHGSSYFYVFVDPGVHHLCASWQSTVVLGQGHKTAAAHFTAEAGGVYYFQVKNNFLLHDGFTGMSFSPLDSDEGHLLANDFSFSNSQPKK